MPQGKQKPREARLSMEKTKNALKIISELKIKMRELQKIEKSLSKQEKLVSPKKTAALIEEIQVPSLEIIKDESKKSKMMSSRA